MMTGQGKTLTDLYEHYNRLHFGSQLPSYQVKQSLTDNKHAGQCIRSERLILLHEDLSGGELIAGLLHEMCHARVGGIASHGSSFVNELRRLVEAGETCLEADLAYYGSRLAARFAEADRHYSESQRCIDARRRLDRRIGIPRVERRRI